ncbi:MAG: T9SS type A sorting domain-containing protein [Bacteroidales bacterium]|nr:T9SS type A sorting domain-containing protein [Bacteroidales bacterium]
MKKTFTLLFLGLLFHVIAGGQNLLLNGDFEGATLDPWWVFVDAGNAAASVDSSAGSVNYEEITNPGSNTYDIQLIQELSGDQIAGLEANLNEYYRLTLTAIVPEARNCNLFFGEIGGSWTNLAGGYVFNFSAGTTEYTTTIHITATFDAMKFGLELGTSDVPVEFDDISLELVVPDQVESMQNGGLVSVYPNPANNVVYIRAEQGSNVSLYTTTGQLLQTRSAEGNETEFDVSNLTAGVYLVSIQSGSESILERILIR